MDKSKTQERKKKYIGTQHAKKTRDSHVFFIIFYDVEEKN